MSTLGEDEKSGSINCDDANVLETETNTPSSENRIRLNVSSDELSKKHHGVYFVTYLISLYRELQVFFFVALMPQELNNTEGM